MPSFSTSDVVLVHYPFTDLSSLKIRPAVIVATFAGSPDFIIVPLTSRVVNLAAGEFMMTDW